MDHYKFYIGNQEKSKKIYINCCQNAADFFQCNAKVMIDLEKLEFVGTIRLSILKSKAGKSV